MVEPSSFRDVLLGVIADTAGWPEYPDDAADAVLATPEMRWLRMVASAALRWGGPFDPIPPTIRSWLTEESP